MPNQSVKTTGSEGIRGFDAAKLVKRPKRHIITDTSGLLAGAMVHAADIQDRNGAPALLASMMRHLPVRAHSISPVMAAPPPTTWAIG